MGSLAGAQAALSERQGNLLLTLTPGVLFNLPSILPTKRWAQNI
jgi:hypothetical protein